MATKLFSVRLDPATLSRLEARGRQTGEPNLACLSDRRLLAAAQVERRAIVSENVPDFLRLDRLYRQQRDAHHGVVLTTDHRFRRGAEGHIGHLLTSLDEFLRTAPEEPAMDSSVHWLR